MSVQHPADENTVMMTIPNLREEASHGDNFAINTLQSMAQGGNTEAMSTLKNLAELKLPYIFPCLLDMAQDGNEEVFDFLLQLADNNGGYTSLIFQDSDNISGKTFELLKSFKQRGDSFAAMLMRRLAERGNKDALQFITEVARDGDRSSISFLINRAGTGDEAAVALLEEIAETGHADAVFWRDVRTGTISDMMRKHARQGDDRASKALIELVDKGSAEAPYLLKEAADADSLPAIFWFDRMDKDISTTLEKEAWRNNPDAVAVVGDMAEKGNAKAFDLLKRLATTGSRNSHAFMWFRNQVDKGDLMATEFLFTLARRGNSKPIPWLQEQAEKGDVEAIETLKAMIDSGNVEPNGNNELIIWCAKQADQGDLECHDLMNQLAQRGEYLATRWMDERSGKFTKPGESGENGDSDKADKEDSRSFEGLRGTLRNVHQYLQKHLSPPG
jgi:TPR repeat protein